MFILDFVIKDQFLIIIGAAFGVTEQHRAAQIWKERHGEAQSSMGDTEWCQASKSGTKKYGVSQSSDRYHGAA